MIGFHKWYADTQTGVDAFERELAQAVANQLRRIEPADRWQAVSVLQDHTSLYSAYIADLVDELLEDE